MNDKLFRCEDCRNVVTARIRPDLPSECPACGTQYRTGKNQWIKLKR